MDEGDYNDLTSFSSRSWTHIFVLDALMLLMRKKLGVFEISVLKSLLIEEWSSIIFYFSMFFNMCWK